MSLFQTIKAMPKKTMTNTIEQIEPTITNDPYDNISILSVLYKETTINIEIKLTAYIKNVFMHPLFRIFLFA